MPHPRRLLTVATIAVALLTGGRVGAQQGGSQAERDAVRSQLDTVSADLDVLAATDAEIRAELDRIDTALANQATKIADARTAAEAAKVAEATADAEVATATAEVDELTVRARELAIQLYTRPADQETILAVIRAKPGDAAKRLALARFRVEDASELLDQLVARKGELEAARRVAADARLAAEQAAAAEQARLEELQALRVEQFAFAEDLANRIEHKLFEAEFLRSRDADLAARIEAEQRELIGRLPQGPPPTPPPAAPPSGGGTSPTTTAPPTGTTTPPTRTPVVTPVETTWVGGIEVATSIAGQVRGLIDAAAADGITLWGYGYRDIFVQIELRRAHCGTSDYEIWDMPSWQCTPWVARPGTSMHESGLAIDFVSNGDLIRSQSNPGFVWLSENASRFGLYNLPAEPWHWSTNGR